MKIRMCTAEKYMSTSVRKSQESAANAAVYTRSNDHSKYLGANVTSNGVKEEMQAQTTKAAMMIGHLRDVIWRNEHMSLEQAR